MSLLVEPLLAQARAEARAVLDDGEAFALAEALGVPVAPYLSIDDPAALSDEELRGLGTPTVVVKARLATSTHRARSGAVAMVAADVSAVQAAMAEMRGHLRSAITGFTVAAHVHGDPGVGELLLGARRSRDFGTVVLLGPGGVHAEQRIAAGGGWSLWSAEQLDEPGTLAALRHSPMLHRLAEAGHDHAMVLRNVLRRLAGLLRDADCADVVDIELNPLVWTADGPIALDVLVRRRTAEVEPRIARWHPDLRPLFEPESIAVIGASARRHNPGRVILQQILEAGFPPDRLRVVHPGETRIDGATCVSDVASLPRPCDVVVLAVGAADTPDLLADLVRHKVARSVIAVPGGLGERAGTEDRAQSMRQLLRDARAGGQPTPVVVGGNSMGVASGPGSYDASFVSRRRVHGLRREQEEEVPLALVSQSGALALTVQSRLAGTRPRYMVSVGNQLDLTHADYLEYLGGDSGVQVFGCYVEGFAPGDGARWLRAAREITASGRQVVLYRAGRTAAGASATSSHTASIAGDYAVTEELAARAGVTVADSLEKFADLIRLLVRFHDQPVRGPQLGLLSNAGFECVAAADHLGGLELAELTPDTAWRLDTLLARNHLDGVVTVQNPLDITPTAGDVAVVDAARAVLEDENVDIALFGCVPFADALSTLGTNVGLAARLGAMFAESVVPFAVVVDAGTAYDPFVAQLERQRIPTFRTMDRAVRALDLFCAARRQTIEQREGGVRIARPAAPAPTDSPEEMARW